MSTKVYPLDFFPTFYNMQSVTSNAVAQALNRLKKSDGGSSVGSRTDVATRAGAILNVLINNPNVTNFSINYNGGYVYGYLTNVSTSTQEKYVLEINPYEAQLSIFYVNNTLSSCGLQRTI